MEGVVLIVLVIVLSLGIPGVPGYVIAKRRGLSTPWVAFLPFFGLWIILCESTGHSGLFGLIVLVPWLGVFILSIWMAIEVPSRHGRTRWWTLALIVPGVNLLGYWAYAFTLPTQTLGLQIAVA